MSLLLTKTNPFPWVMVCSCLPFLDCLAVPLSLETKRLRAEDFTEPLYNPEGSVILSKTFGHWSPAVLNLTLIYPFNCVSMQLANGQNVWVYVCLHMSWDTCHLRVSQSAEITESWKLETCCHCKQRVWGQAHIWPTCVAARSLFSSWLL